MDELLFPVVKVTGVCADDFGAAEQAAILSGEGSSQVQDLLFVDVFGDCRCHDEVHRTQHHLSHDEGTDVHDVRPTLANLAVYDFLESPFTGLKALGVELAEFHKVLAVAEAVAKDPYVESYLKLKSKGKPELIDFDFTGRGEHGWLSLLVVSTSPTCDTRLTHGHLSKVILSRFLPRCSTPCPVSNTAM